MKRIMLLVILGLTIEFATACGGFSGSSSGNGNGPASGAAGTAHDEAMRISYSPNVDPADFATKIDNSYFPLKPGNTFVYEGTTANSTEGDTVVVTHNTKRVMGVECVIVKDTVTEEGEMTEKTYDWYAQDDKGNVWYFGENSGEYENGRLKSKEGSWEAGKRGAEPGIIMPADPVIGKSYRQEYLKGVAEDMARPVKLGGSASVPYGTFHRTLVTDEWTPLEKNVAEQKYYAPGVGNVLELSTRGPKERLELTDIEHE